MLIIIIIASSFFPSIQAFLKNTELVTMYQNDKNTQCIKASRAACAEFRILISVPLLQWEVRSEGDI